MSGLIYLTCLMLGLKIWCSLTMAHAAQSNIARRPDLFGLEAVGFLDCRRSFQKIGKATALLPSAAQNQAIAIRNK